MAKIDTAIEIVEEFPDRDYEAEKLAADHTQAELDQLQTELRAAKPAPSAPPEAPEESEPTTTEPTVEKPVKKYKLANPATSYQEIGFTLANDQEKELPENPSSPLTGRIKSGFIVEVK